MSEEEYVQKRSENRREQCRTCHINEEGVCAQHSLIMLVGKSALRTIVGLVGGIVVLLLAIFGYILVMHTQQGKIDEKLTTHLADTQVFLHTHKLPKNFIEPTDGGEE